MRWNKLTWLPQYVTPQSGVIHPMPSTDRNMASAGTFSTGLWTTFLVQQYATHDTAYIYKCSGRHFMSSILLLQSRTGILRKPANRDCTQICPSCSSVFGQNGSLLWGAERLQEGEMHQKRAELGREKAKLCRCRLLLSLREREVQKPGCHLRGDSTLGRQQQQQPAFPESWLWTYSHCLIYQVPWAVPTVSSSRACLDLIHKANPRETH